MNDTAPAHHHSRSAEQPAGELRVESDDCCTSSERAMDGRRTGWHRSERHRAGNHLISVTVVAQTTLPACGLAVMEGSRRQPRGTRVEATLIRTSAPLPGRHL
jgi:hypothetical protein